MTFYRPDNPAERVKAPKSVGRQDGTSIPPWPLHHVPMDKRKATTCKHSVKPNLLDDGGRSASVNWRRGGDRQRSLYFRVPRHLLNSTFTTGGGRQETPHPSRLLLVPRTKTIIHGPRSLAVAVSGTIWHRHRVHRPTRSDCSSRTDSWQY